MFYNQGPGQNLGTSHPFLGPQYLSIPQATNSCPSAVEYPEVTRWFHFLDEHEERRKDGIGFAAFGDVLKNKGFLRITQLHLISLHWRTCRIGWALKWERPYSLCNMQRMISKVSRLVDWLFLRRWQYFLWTVHIYCCRYIVPYFWYSSVFLLYIYCASYYEHYFLALHGSLKWRRVRMLLAGHAITIYTSVRSPRSLTTSQRTMRRPRTVWMRQLSSQMKRVVVVRGDGAWRVEGQQGPGTWRNRKWSVSFAKDTC